MAGRCATAKDGSEGTDCPGRIEYSGAAGPARRAAPPRLARHAARRLIDAGSLLLEEWLPSRCVLCARREAPASARVGRSLCADCEASLPGLGSPRCPGCALPWSAPGGSAGRMPVRASGLQTMFCPACRPCDGDPSDRAADLVLHPALEAAAGPCASGVLDAALAALDYAPPVDRLILAMKRGETALAAPLGALAALAAASTFTERSNEEHSGAERFEAARVGVDRAEAGRTRAGRLRVDALRSWLDDLQPDVVVPMPLSARRLARRGFDQTRLLARPVARRLGLPLAGHLLRRTRDTAQQKGLQAAGRAANLAGAFRAADQTAGRRILLVDDVMTTGATLHEAARTLKEAGAAAVVGLAVARVR